MRQCDTVSNMKNYSITRTIFFSLTCTDCILLELCFPESYKNDFIMLEYFSTIFYGPSQCCSNFKEICRLHTGEIFFYDVLH